VRWGLQADISDLEMGDRGAAMGAALRDDAVGYDHIPALFEQWLGIGGGM
jgi:hypothetical protein